MATSEHDDDRDLPMILRHANCRSIVQPVETFEEACMRVGRNEPAPLEEAFGALLLHEPVMLERLLQLDELFAD